MIDFSKTEKKMDSITPIIKEIRKESIQYLKEVAEKNNGYFDLTEYDDDYGSVCVTYDGGNHPEYASNAFSTVQAVKVEDGTLMFETEDTDWYDSCNVETTELFGVASFIDGIISDKEETTKKD
jgi:hypothetical protein